MANALCYRSPSYSLGIEHLHYWNQTKATIAMTAAKLHWPPFLWDPQCWNYRRVHSMPGLYVNAGDLNSDPQFCAVSTFTHWRSQTFKSSPAIDLQNSARFSPCNTNPPLDLPKCLLSVSCLSSCTPLSNHLSPYARSTSHRSVSHIRLRGTHRKDYVLIRFGRPVKLYTLRIIF